MKQPPHETLCQAHDRQDWDFLWRAAIPLVKFCIKRMMRHGEIDPYWAREDLLQEGMLAAGLAVRSWNTLESKFSTWITLKVRGHLLNYLNEVNNGGIGKQKVSTTVVSLHESRHGVDIDENTGEEADVSQTRLDSLTYEEDCGIPLPETAVGVLQIREAVRRIADPIEQDVLMQAFGFDGADETLRVIGPGYGRSYVWAHRVLSSAINRVTKDLLGLIPTSRRTKS